MEQENKENINSTNDDQENLNSENEEQTTEEADATADETNEESTEETSDDTSEETEFTDRERRLYARAKKAEEELKELRGAEKETKKPTAPKESPEDIAIARLEARGVLDNDDQSFIMKYAKVEGVSPIEALEDDFVQERLKANEQRRKSAQAAPRNNNRAANPADEVAVAVKRFKQDGSLPENNPALTAKVLRALKSGA